MNGSGKTWERPDAPLGTLVYRAGLLSKEKLEAALAEGQQTGRRLGEILLQKGWIEEKDLARLLAGQKGLAFVSLKGRGFDPEVARLLGERVSRFHCALAMEEENGSVLVAIADPTDDTAVSDIGGELGRDFQLVVATGSEIRTALDEVFAAVVATPTPPAPPPLTVAGGAGTGDFGLRVAPPPAGPEASDSPVFLTGTVSGADVEPAPALEHEPERDPEPELDREPEPVVTAFSANGGDRSPLARPDLPAEPVRAEPADAHEQDTPVVIHDPSGPGTPGDAPSHPASLLRLDEPPAAEFPPAEPTIERNEERHVSVAFHVPAVDQEPRAAAEPEPVQEPASDAAPVAAVPAAMWAPEPASEPEPSSAPSEDPPPVPLEVAGPDSAEEQDPRALPFRVVLVLDGNDELETGFYADEAAAETAARELITLVERREEWPRVDRSFIRPDRILSVDIRERQSWTGSRSRAAWGSHGDGGDDPSAAGTSVF